MKDCFAPNEFWMRHRNRIVKNNGDPQAGAFRIFEQIAKFRSVNYFRQNEPGIFKECAMRGMQMDAGLTISIPMPDRFPKFRAIKRRE